MTWACEKHDLATCLGCALDEVRRAHAERVSDRELLALVWSHVVGKGSLENHGHRRPGEKSCAACMIVNLVEERVTPATPVRGNTDE